jgi:pullulanase
MKDTFLQARLVEKDLIRMVIFSAVPFQNMAVRLIEDGKAFRTLKASRQASTSGLIILDFRLEAPLELGHSYVLSLPDYGDIPLDVSEATSFKGFDEEFFYDGDDLGATYTKRSTTWVVWAPLASSLILKVRKRGQKGFSTHPMKRGKKGDYRITLKGDYELAEYRYLPTNSELTSETTDPYAIGSSPNGEYSVVIDKNKLIKDLGASSLPVLAEPTDQVIYELSVRDMTSDRHADIVHKGKFLGLVEEGRKTEKGLPAGFDYIKSLGVTAVQLMPIFDFKTVDELNPEKTYNWGYDPAQYFVPEGSYSTDVHDPYSRILECQTMIKKFHEAGIRVVMDVVFNHVYDYEGSPFEKLVPNFYFRRRRNGKMAGTTGCGNDVASERPMVRKLIKDACRFWRKAYGIDGFRFDLMGVIDIDTLNAVAKEARAERPDFLLYGEGWDMGGETLTNLGTKGNYRSLPSFGFFNDRFRDSATSFLSGDWSALDAFKHAYASSSLNFMGPAEFLDARQTVNYVECHDDMTFYDKLSSRRPDLPLNAKLEVCKSALAAVLFSIGVPFIHAGQEIGASKWMSRNTYNLGDSYNKFSYALLDERQGMYEYAKSLIALRKRARCLHAYDPRVIDVMMEITDRDGLFIARSADARYAAPYKEIVLLLNPGEKPITYDFGADMRVCVSTAGEVMKAGVLVRSVLISPHTVGVFAR